MNRLIKILALVTAGVVIGRLSKKISNPKVEVRVTDLDEYKNHFNDLYEELEKLKRREITITNLDDELLASIKDDEVISHNDINVYVD